MNSTFLEELIIENDAAGIRKLLTEHPALATELTSHQVSPLMLCCYYHKDEAKMTVLEFIKELSLFEAAAVGKFEEVAHQVYQNPGAINTFSPDNFTALGLACYFGNEEVVRYLLLKGADVNLPSNNGFNVYPIHAAVAGNFVNLTKVLINNEARVNVIQQSGLTPLHSAAQNGNIELIILLLEHGAEVNLRMEGGKLACDLAKEKGYDEIADILSL